MFLIWVWIDNIHCFESKILMIQSPGLLYSCTQHTFVHSSIECCEAANNTNLKMQTKKKFQLIK